MYGSTLLPLHFYPSQHWGPLQAPDTVNILFLAYVDSATVFLLTVVMHGASYQFSSFHLQLQDEIAQTFLSMSDPSDRKYIPVGCQVVMFSRDLAIAFSVYQVQNAILH